MNQGFLTLSPIKEFQVAVVTTMARIGSTLRPALLPFGEFEFTNINKGDINTLDARANYGRENKSDNWEFEFENESLFQRFMSAFGAAEGTTDPNALSRRSPKTRLFLLAGRLQILWRSRTVVQNSCRH